MAFFIVLLFSPYNLKACSIALGLAYIALPNLSGDNTLGFGLVFFAILKILAILSAIPSWTKQFGTLLRVLANAACMPIVNGNNIILLLATMFFFHHLHFFHYTHILFIFHTTLFHLTMHSLHIFLFVTSIIFITLT